MTAAKRLLKSMLRRAGYDVISQDLHDQHARRTRWMNEARLDVLLDVGGNRGQYAQAMRAAGWRGRTVSFEPLALTYKQLRATAATDPNWETRNYALSDHAGQMPIHVTENTDSSSLLPMAALHEQAAPDAKVIGEEIVELRTLDEVAGELLCPADRIYLKIDVQGHEPAVLAGARQTLAQVDFIEQEVSLRTLYQGQQLIEQSIADMRAIGFAAVLFEEAFRDPRTNASLQFDVVFRRERPAMNAV